MDSALHSNAKDIPVVLDDEHILVVSKPPGIVTQGAQAGQNLLALVRDLTGVAVLPVHRLDAETSGLVIFAKHKLAANALATMFAAKSIEKIYLALSDKKPKKKQGKIIGDMEKARAGNWLLRHSKSNPAVTQFVSFGEPHGLRLFVLRPKTGKTHQLRVAMKSIGAPIVGDNRYGQTAADRLYLHAYQLRFSLMDKQYQLVARDWWGHHFSNVEFAQRVDSLGDLHDLFPVLS